MAASSKTSAEPYRSWTMACIVISQAVAGSGPWSTRTAVTGADVVAGTSMLVSPRSGDGTRLRGETVRPILRSVLRSPGGLRCWVGSVGGQGVGQGLVQRGGVDVELGRDLGAVDDEGLLELILQLEQFPHGRVDDAKGS